MIITLFLVFMQVSSCFTPMKMHLKTVVTHEPRTSYTSNCLFIYFYRLTAVQISRCPSTRCSLVLPSRINSSFEESISRDKKPDPFNTEVDQEGNATSAAEERKVKKYLL